MKRFKITITSLVLLLGLGVTSCNKEGCTDPNATNYNDKAEKDDGSCEFNTAEPVSYSPSFQGEYAALIAIQTMSTIDTPVGPMDTELGTAVAVFSENSGTDFVDAGTVKVDTKTLPKHDNNSYVYTMDATDPTGLVFNSTVNWEGTGATWEAFSASTSQGFSTVNTITSGGSISTGSSYTLSSGSVANADSVLYAVYGPGGSKLVTVAGNVTSYTFTASDLSGLGEGSGYAQVVGLKYDKQVISSKDYWLINETVRTKQVNVTP